MKQVAVITGCSSGIGYETSILLAKNGFKTYATMRNVEKGDKLKDIAEKENLDLKIIKLDVTDDYSIKNAINEIIQETSRIDILVNNAGNNIAGTVEDLSIEEFKEQFETNFFGLVRVTKAVLPIMRNQNNGIIVNLSSIVGKMAIPLNSAYTSSKFAVEGFSESVRYELEDFGIKVILIEPGVIKSNFYENIKMSKNSLADPKSPYQPITQKIFEAFLSMIQYAFPAKIVADVILEAITSDNPKIRYAVGDDAKSITEAKKRLSDKEFENWVKEGFFEKKGFIRE
ncbi:MAG TPA: SDR family oxidoreductase [Nitrososphaeraceae archaeon]|nr:SDR family oxidoreductase [Nitrososphaeraceae archaeon]